MPGEWAQQDLIQKSAILQTLYSKIDDLSTDDKEGLIDYLAACLVEKPIKEEIEALKGEIDALFGKASKKELTYQEFEDFFKLLKPLDAKLLPFNCEALGIKPWPNSKTARHFPEHAQASLEEYISDSDIPAALSFRNSEGQSIDIAPSNVYPIHSVAKVFTGVIALMMVHEKPDGENSILPKANLRAQLDPDDPDDPPIKSIKEQLDLDAWALLPPAVQTHIESNNITLRQVMTHLSGLGDYGYDLGTGTYRDKLERGDAPVVSEVRDFLPFAEEKTYTVGEFHYSNLGITLAGLAVEHAYKTYQDIHPELSLPPLNFFRMLKNYILNPANMTNFFERAPKDNAVLSVQTNPDDKAAPDWVGGPAGGYWTTTEDLVKFGQWLHEKCQDPTFRDLIDQHGDEFYNGKKCGLVKMLINPELVPPHELKTILDGKPSYVLSNGKIYYIDEHLKCDELSIIPGDESEIEAIFPRDFGKVQDALTDQLIKLTSLTGHTHSKEGRIWHPGNSPYASAFFSVDLESGNTFALGSTGSSGVSLGLELTLGARVFTEEKTVEEDLGSGSSAHSSVTEQFRNAVAQINRDGEVTAENVAKEPSSITPFQTTPKPPGIE